MWYKIYTAHLWDKSVLFIQSFLTFTVTEDCLHGAFPVSIPADPGWAGCFCVLWPPALPQVYLMIVIHQEQS